MSNQRLIRLRVSVTYWLRPLYNTSQLLLLIFCKLNITGREVGLEPLRLCRARNGDHALCRNPGQRDLGDSAVLPVGKLLDLINDCPILVEVLALELWCCVSSAGAALSRAGKTHMSDENRQERSRPAT